MLVYEDILSLDAHYRILGVEPGSSLAEVDRAYTAWWKANQHRAHSDKGGDDKLAQKMNSAKAAIRHAHSEAYERYSKTNLAFFASVGTALPDILPGVLTHRIGDTTYKVRPEFVDGYYAEPLRRIFALYAIAIFNYLERAKLDRSPTVLSSDYSLSMRVNANNYTVHELMQLYAMMITGTYSLSYPLRYQNKEGMSDLHQLMVGLINSERFDRTIVDKARTELNGYDRVVKIGDRLANTAWICFGVGVGVPSLFLVFMSDAQATAFMSTLILPGLSIGGVMLLVGVLIPSVLAIARLIHRRWSLSNYDALGRYVVPFLSKQFIVTNFTDRGVNWSINMTNCHAVDEISGLTVDEDHLDDLFTSAESLTEAPLGYLESTRAYVGSFFSSADVKSADARETSDVELQEQEPLLQPGFATPTGSINDID